MFAMGSCQSYHGGYYTVFQRLAEEDFDLVVHLGDYIYEESYGFTRDHFGNPLPEYTLGETVDLRTYRLQYSVYKSDPHLQAAHALAPWLVTFDDHEVEDGWRMDVSEDGQDPASFQRRKADAFQAMYENLPLRHTQMPQGPNIRMHRRIGYGALADFTLLDSRQYRSSRNGRLDPNATMLGGEQAQWLIDGFATSQSRWQFIGNQLPMAQVDRDPDPEVVSWFGDSWDAYVYERNRILGGAAAANPENFVILTGDRHSNYLMDLKPDYNDPDSPVVGTEIVGTSFSSGRDGFDFEQTGENYMAANPHMRFCNFQRGYSRVTVTPGLLTQDFRVLPYISRPDAPVTTRASFVIENRNPQAQPA